MIALVDFDTAVHIRRQGNLAFRISFKLGIDTANVFTADQGHAAQGRSDRKMLPVLTGNFGRTQSSGKDRESSF